jgi:hypothetical protein
MLERFAHGRTAGALALLAERSALAVGDGPFYTASARFLKKPDVLEARPRLAPFEHAAPALA